MTHGSSRGTGATRGRALTVGYLKVAGAAVLWGSSGIFADALVANGMPPESIALLRAVVGGAALLLGATLFRREALLLDWRGFLLLAGVGGVAAALFQIAYLMSLATTGVPTTVALLYLAPAIVLAAAGPLLGEWPGPGQIALGALGRFGPRDAEKVPGGVLHVVGVDRFELGDTGVVALGVVQRDSTLPQPSREVWPQLDEPIEPIRRRLQGVGGEVGLRFVVHGLGIGFRPILGGQRSGQYHREKEDSSHDCEAECVSRTRYQARPASRPFLSGADVS